MGWGGDLRERTQKERRGFKFSFVPVGGCEGSGDRAGLVGDWSRVPRQVLV